MSHLLKPNHLAQTIDHQKSATLALPEQISKKIAALLYLTEEIKTIFNNCLPEEVLNTLHVGKYENGNLTLSVQSHTAANHLKYLSNNLISALKEQSITFNQLKHINVIVNHSALSTDSNDTSATLKKDDDLNNKAYQAVQSHDIHGLSQTTKRTIAHTADHVITDWRLKKALKRLVED